MVREHDGSVLERCHHEFVEHYRVELLHFRMRLRKKGEEEKGKRGYEPLASSIFHPPVVEVLSSSSFIRAALLKATSSFLRARSERVCQKRKQEEVPGSDSEIRGVGGHVMCRIGWMRTSRIAFCQPFSISVVNTGIHTANPRHRTPSSKRCKNSSSPSSSTSSASSPNCPTPKCSSLL